MRLFCIMVVGVGILDYLCPSFIVKFDLAQTRVELTEGGVEKGARANHHLTELEVKILLFVSIYDFKLMPFVLHHSVLYFLLVSLFNKIKVDRVIFIRL